MGIPGLGKGGKLNMGAMEAQMNKNMKSAKMRERMKSKVDAKNNSHQTTTTPLATNVNQLNVTDEEIIKIFSTGETVEKTPRGSKPPQPVNHEKPVNHENKKKKKNK
jgi:hypothetical protein